MMLHKLKVWPEFFREIVSGVKTFEIRNNDRDFSVGDYLVLAEWCPDKKGYTGLMVFARIGYVTDFKQADGYVVFSLADVDRSPLVGFQGCFDLLRRG